VLVRVDDDRVALALRDRDRHELVAIATLGDRRGGVALAGQGEGVLILAADAQPLGHVLARLAHRDTDGGRRQRRVDEAPAQRRVDQFVGAAFVGRLGLEHHVRRPAHRLDAAGDEDVAVADGDGVGGRVDRLQAAAAQPVDRQPADLDRQPRKQAAIRATLRLSSPAWLAQPRITSSISAGSMPVRSTSARMTAAARSSGRTEASAPP
jgi:hypothetical protein